MIYGRCAAWSVQGGDTKRGWSGALMRRLIYNDDVAAGQLAVFQGAVRAGLAVEASISGFIRIEVRAGLAKATPKNSRLAAAQRVALKMGRRRGCSSVTYRFRYAPSYCQSGSDRLAGGPF